ncbi:MAG: DnaA N-terminal domain-containing protein, partial [Chloroflexota bacterium]
MADPTAQRVWDAALGQLQIHVTRPNYETWLKDTRGLRVSDGQFVVGVPTEFVKEWLGTRMKGIVSQTVGGILGHPTEVSFEILVAATSNNGNGNGRANGHSSNGNGNGNGRTVAAEEDMALANVSPVHSIISSPLLRQRLNPKYTFRTF